MQRNPSNFSSNAHAGSSNGSARRIGFMALSGTAPALIRAARERSIGTHEPVLSLSGLDKGPGDLCHFSKEKRSRRMSSGPLLVDRLSGAMMERSAVSQYLATTGAGPLPLPKSNL